MEKFKVIDSLVQSVDEMKLDVDKRCARRIIESDSSTSKSDSESDYESDADNDTDNDGAISDPSSNDDVRTTDGATEQHNSGATPKKGPLKLR